MAKPLIIGHRGAPADHPENTLPGFRRAAALGVDGVELDVRVTSDGVAVVFHDASLRRLTSAPGRLAATPWAELRQRRVRGTAPIPRLAEVLRFARGRHVVQIEVKPGVPVAPVVGAIRSAGAGNHVILASFSTTILRAAARLAPGVPRMLIVGGRPPGPDALARRLASLGARGISIDHRLVRGRSWVRHFQARGASVWCWTVNDAARARALARLGVDALLTDNPALLRSA